FGVSACVWEAAALRGSGASVEAVAERARVVGLNVATTFILQALEFARLGGRIDTTDLGGGPGEPIMVLGGVGTRLEVTGQGRTVEELCDHMADSMLAAGVPIRAAVSLADDATLPFTVGIEERLRASDLVVDMVRYRVGPSIAAHTGPGTAGGFWWPAS
ncbi:MAG: DegV family protein, partial [Acidimicrobiales bacterium]